MLAASLPLLLSLVCVCASKATSFEPDRGLCADVAASPTAPPQAIPWKTQSTPVRHGAKKWAVLTTSPR
jgi:hypothetical protein